MQQKCLTEIKERFCLDNTLVVAAIYFCWREMFIKAISTKSFYECIIPYLNLSKQSDFCVRIFLFSSAIFEDSSVEE